MEKRQERQTNSSKKEHTTKLITPQIAKVEHSYRPGKWKECFVTPNIKCVNARVIFWKFDVCLSTVQFAGSLGKLTVSSVNNPRKMIDAVVTARSDDEVCILICNDSLIKIN